MEHVSIRASDGVVLEGLVLREEFANDDGSAAREAGSESTAVVLLHPHPKLGGDMRNNVVITVARALAASGYTALTLNTRGVGKSTGRASWKGNAERADVAAAVEFARTELPGVTRVVVCGYSFGAAVGCSVHEGVDAFVAISYPYGSVARCALGSLYSKADADVPKLFLVGGRDQFASASKLQSFVNKLQDPTEFACFDDVDHFWVGHEHLLAAPILHFLASL